MLDVSTIMPGVFYIVAVPMGLFLLFRPLAIKFLKNEKINLIDRRN